MPSPVPDGALCLSCNYALRGLESRRCPECGREFDPDAPLTMNLGRPLDRVAITLLRPIGRWAPATMWSLAVTGVLGPAWLVPSNLLARLWLLLWGGFLCACWWRSVLRRAVVARYRQPPECLRIDDPFRRRTRRVFVLVTLLILTRAPFLLALLISRPWLDHQAYYIWTVLPANVEPQEWPRWQGLVMVRRIDAGPTYVTFHLFGGGTVAYRPRPTEKAWNARGTPGRNISDGEPSGHRSSIHPVLRFPNVTGWVGHVGAAQRTAFSMMRSTLGRGDVDRHA